MKNSWINNYFDGFTIEKGRDYFNQNRVKSIKFEDDELTAKVWGTGANPYDTKIHLEKSGICHTECSCPIGDGCKHCSALALAYLSEQNNLALPTINAAAKQVVSGPPVKIGAWQKFLEPIIGGKQETNSDAATPWRLQIILRTNEPDYYQEGVAEGAELLVELRPQKVHNQTGKTIFSGVEWNSLENLKTRDYQYYVHEPDKQPPRSQIIWLCNLHDALNPDTGYYFSSKDWLPVPARKAADVFRLLLTAEEFGIDIKDLAGIKVNISNKPVKNSLVITEAGNNVTISPELTQDGKVIDMESLETGRPPVFVLLTGKQPNSKQPLELRPVIQAGAGVKKFERPLAIPQNELDQFVKEYLPLLARDFYIISQTEKIKPPILGDPVLNISVNKISPQSIGIENYLAYNNRRLDLAKNDIYLDNGNEAPIARNLRLENRLSRVVTEKIIAAGIKTAAREQFTLAGAEAKSFLEKVLPSLREHQNIILESAADLPRFEEVLGAPKIEIEMEQGQSQDWFDLQLKIFVDGASIPVAEILNALAQNSTLLFLADGRYIDLSKSPEIQKLQALLKRANKLKDVAGGKLSISKFEAGWFEQLKELGIVAKQSKLWEDSVGKLKNSSAPELLPHPKNWQHKLRDYQLEGFSWLNFLAENNLGGILADDMGLGKTAQSIALICKVAETTKLPTLIVAPTSVVESWDMELKKFAPELKTAILRSGDRKAALKTLGKNQVVITSYALVRRDFEILKKQVWKMLVLDEAQMLKNYQSQSYGLIRQLNAGVKIGLSGTPMENNLSELWSVFSIVCPGLFSDIEHFKEFFQKPIERFSNKEALDSLRKQIRPFIMRRKKELLGKELPAKIEQISLMDLQGRHRKIYDLWLAKQRQLVLGLIEQGGMKANRFAILTALTRLRQLCLHPALVDKKHLSVEAVKVEGLIGQIEAIVDGGHQVLVFSQFTGFLEIIRSRLSAEGYFYSYIDGSVKKRREEIDKFQSGKTKIFLISLKAGGFGLNLTAADYCIMLDPWWNPAAEAQAIDRAHRIGQTKQVMVYRFIAKNTIEEKVLKLQEKKRSLFKNVLDEGEFFSQMITEDDIKSILE